ncbi:MAG TPA: polyketide cyclase [Rhodanobacteraceae bacterium]|nr:polyketide cyclase [Rhodanobacteraceae bacterium]
MTRVIEVLAAVLMVVVLGLVVALLMPDEGSTSRSIEVSHNLRHVYDILNNYRRFPDYGVLRAYDPNTTFNLSGPAYGPGATISWQSSNPKVLDGSLDIVSAEPAAGDVSTQGSATIVWKLKHQGDFLNGWYGHDQRFEIDLERAGSSQKLVRITMRYKVNYGWNLIDRLSQLYIHGEPAAFIQYTLNNLQNTLASIPNIGYGGVKPQLVATPQQPILFVSTTAKRTLGDVDAATSKAMTEIDAAMKRLGVTAAGQPTTFTTDYGDENYRFDVAVPISSSTLTIAGQSDDLTQPGTPAAAASAAQAGGTTTPTAGTWLAKGVLEVGGPVQARIAFGGRALTATWNGSPAGVPLTRLQLKAYALTHGYAFDDGLHRFYDVLMTDPATTAYDQQTFNVYLPVFNAPSQTPEQAAAVAAPAVASSAPAAAMSTPASAGSAPAVAVSGG